MKAGIKEFHDEDGNPTSDPVMINRLCRHMPWASAEHLSIEILARETEDRSISGIYECPMCGQKHRAMYDPRTEIDTRDSLDDLQITYMPDEAPRTFRIELEEPVQITDRVGNVIKVVESIDMRIPEMNDLISGALRNRDDDSRAQLSTYANAIVAYNGEDAAQGHVAALGEPVMNRMIAADIRKIGIEMRRYEMRKTIEKSCSCGYRWNAPANLESFFVSGLQAE
jgi:hypothetical protein